MDSREKMFSRDFAVDSIVPNLLSRGNGLAQLEEGKRKYLELQDQANLELRKNAFTYHNAILKASTEMQILEKNLLEFKNTLAEEKQALNVVMNLNENAAIRQEHRKSTHFNGSLENVINRYKVDDEKVRSDSGGSVSSTSIPSWFMTAATDLEDHYEMRRYNDAVDVLVAAKSFFKSLQNADDVKCAEVHYRLIMDAEEGLITHLLEAFKAALDCPFGMDTATCQRILNHIKFLGNTYDACVALLDNRTRLLQLTWSSMILDKSISILIRQRCQLLFSRLIIAIKEFDEFGFDGAQCRSALIGWIRFHINSFTSEYSDQIFSSTNSLAIAAEATAIIRSKSSLLCDMGVETLPMINAGLENESIRFIELHISLFVQSSQRILQDGQIQPVTFKNKESVAVYLETIAKAGLGMAAPFIDGLRLNVSEQFIQFGKVVLRLIKDVVAIATPSLAGHVKLWMHSVVAALTTALQTASLRSSDPDINMTALIGTAEFGLRNILPRAEEVIREKYVQFHHVFSGEREALNRLLTSLKSRIATSPTLV